MTTPWRPPSTPGDHDPAIIDAKRALSRYSYGKSLGSTDEYTVTFGVALRQFQVNRNGQIMRGEVRDMPGMNVEGKLDWATKKNLLILPEQLHPPRQLPVIFTIAGHLGDMFTGPAYLTARWLEERKLVRIQPIGYDNGTIPFNNRSGFDMFMEAVNDPRILPGGTDWAVGAHSQGALIASWLLEDFFRPGKARNEWPWNHWKGSVHWGNPWREQGVVASFIGDPPGPDFEGLALRRIVNTPPEVQEVARKGDLYASAKHGAQETEMKRAVYQAVADGNFFIGQDTLGEQMAEIALSFGLEIWNVFVAIVDAIGFAANQSPHNIFDLGPSVDHFRRVLSV